MIWVPQAATYLIACGGVPSADVGSVRGRGPVSAHPTIPKPRRNPHECVLTTARRLRVSPWLHCSKRGNIPPAEVVDGALCGNVCTALTGLSAFLHKAQPLVQGRQTPCVHTVERRLLYRRSRVGAPALRLHQGAPRHQTRQVDPAGDVTPPSNCLSDSNRCSDCAGRSPARTAGRIIRERRVRN